ncbi:MAG: histidine kinase, partial [Sphingobacteriaceae bacterium]
KDILNFQGSNSTFWLKITIKNNDYQNKSLIEIIQPFLNEVNFYYPLDNGYKEIKAGELYPFNQRRFNQSTNFVFDIDIKPGEEKTYFFEVNGYQQILIPIQIVDINQFYSNISTQNIWFGVYCGIIVVMFLYNIFIYFSIRDKSYIYYVLHTIFVGLTQSTLIGYSYKYFWPNSPWFGNFSAFLLTCLVSIIGTQFLIEFMYIKKRLKNAFVVLKVFQVIYILYIILSLSGYYSTTWQIILVTQTIVAITILIISIYLYREGYNEAKFYLIGWSLFMLSLIVFVTKDSLSWIPYNLFTKYSLLFGSATEVTLLSFALADKINIYKKEKEISQAATLSALQENDRIIREQNSTLERKVTERTNELVATNNNLSKTLTDLKEAQTQLVEAEKMASLGLLTAGIAHEINNPINFVTSNVGPLRRDVDLLVDAITNIESVGLSDISMDEKQQQIEDYKEEIELDFLKIEINHLLNGINEGATRTADIVKGLKIFSRLDENDLKRADINEGLQSTLTIANNLIGDKIQVIKNFGNIPAIECYPGKLNQVFLNIVSNAVFAIQEKFNNQTGGILKVTTENDEQYLTIKIQDNGTGMSEATKKKIFEPFFTTKNVGIGTGLGMSIVYNTIKKHNAEIYLNSEEGVGTEFIIQLNLVFTEPIADYQSEQQG